MTETTVQAEVSSDERVEAVLSTDRDDEVIEALDLTRGELKQAIRSGQFDDEELVSIVRTDAFTQDEIDILVANPTEVSKDDGEEAAPKAKKEKKESSSSQLVTKITETLSKAGTGLTVDEICISIGALVEGFDPKDSGNRSTLKKYRALARKAVDEADDGNRTETIGRNRLYAIGTVESRVEPDEDEDEDEE